MTRSFAAVILSAALCTSANAAIVATSASYPSSNSVVLIELHDELAQPDVCQGRSGFPLALIGEGRGLTSPIEKVGVGCWAPDGAGNVVVTALGYPNGNFLKAVKSTADYTKTEHFTDWNMRPVSVGVAAKVTPPQTDDITLTRVRREPEGVLITELYDISMPCALGDGGKAGSIEAISYDGTHKRVNGCWVREGVDVAFIGHMSGQYKPLRARFAFKDFSAVTQTAQ